MVVRVSGPEPLAHLEHDLRAPLCAIRAMVEALEDGVVSEPDTLSQYYARIGRQLAQLTSLVNDLFALDRLGSATPLGQMRPTDLGYLVADVADAATDLARARGVRLQARLPSRPLPRQLMDPGGVRRAVWNLVDNAVRHTPLNSAVRVEVGSASGYAYVAVADACGGIPGQDLALLFEPGFRGRATTASQGGAGLGLAIVRAIARAHHGEVSVQNEQAGCRFVLRLPRLWAGPGMRRPREVS